jgi:hypothetical protein
MTYHDMEPQSMKPEAPSRRMEISVPVKVRVHTEEAAEELAGCIEELGEENARICLDQPVAEGTELSILVEFKNDSKREIRLQYEGKVVSAFSDPWYTIAVDFEKGVGISGEHAREILAELFPGED